MIRAIAICCALLPMAALADEAAPQAPEPISGADYMEALLGHYQSNYVPPSASERCENALLFAESILASELVRFDFDIELTIVGRDGDMQGVSCTLSSNRSSIIETRSDDQ